MSLPLNSEQRIAVETVEGPIVCISGPGSGKTTVIVDRYKNLLSQGVPPSSILTLTFTQQAAREMADRAGFSAGSAFRTFHSYALSLLKREYASLPFQLTPDIIPAPGDVFKTICHLCSMYRGIPNYRTVAEGISLFKRRSLTPEQAIDQAYEDGDGLQMLIAQAYRDYERMCRLDGWLDFDSIMLEAVRLLSDNSEIRERNQVDYLQVDEGQDTDNTQFELIRLLTKKNVFIVGDENQLIYEWRSAMPGSLTNFYGRFPGTKTLYLGANHRSTRAIVAFLKTILPVDNGLASHMIAWEGSPEGIPPTITQYIDDEQEAQKVIEAVTDPEHTAIIARTNRQLELFRYWCLKKGLKFQFLGESGFWDRGEVKKLIQMLRERKSSRPQSAADAIRFLVESSGLVDKYKTRGKFGETDPQENINGVLRIASRFENVPDFLAYVTKLTYASRNKTGIILSTVHQMKGKEARHVFLVGACNGVLPHQKGALAEERRIFYVACSRAARFLHISYYGTPSMFILPFLDDTKTVQEIPGSQTTLF